MQFLLGAAVFGLGILVGASIVQATVNKTLNSIDKDN